VGCVQVLSLGEVIIWKFRQDDFIVSKVHPFGIWFGDQLL
jgi:hypothetical protein